MGGATGHVKETLMESRPGMRVEWRPGRDRGSEEEVEEKRRSRSKWTLKWIFYSHEECRDISGEASHSIR